MSIHTVNRLNTFKDRLRTFKRLILSMVIQYRSDMWKLLTSGKDQLRYCIGIAGIVDTYRCYRRYFRHKKTDPTNSSRIGYVVQSFDVIDSIHHSQSPQFRIPHYPNKRKCLHNHHHHHRLSTTEL